MRFPSFAVKSIRSQLMLVIVLSTVSVITSGRLIERMNMFEYDGVVTVDLIGQRALTLAYLLDGAGADERQRIISRSAEVGIDIEIISKAAFHALPAPDGFRSNFGNLLTYLFPTDEALPDGAKVLIVDRTPMLSMPVNDSEVLLYKTYPDSIFTNDLTGPMLYYALAFLILGILFSLFAIKFLSGPLANISTKIKDTEAFLSHSTPLPEEGSEEIVDLARALNNMRTRIHDMMRSRTAMLRSVSHDLRTPLTRVRLRLDRITDTVVRDQILADVQHINAMINVTLDYLRDDRGKEVVERTDVASIMQTICDDFSDVGAKISYAGPGRLIWPCKPMALTRAVTNLCENGIKFGEEVEMALSLTQQALCIEVRDIGPGIPELFRQRVLEPFFQVDAARTKKSEQTGFGLGLSIVDEIVRDHGGRVEFDTNKPTGLVVRLVFPKAI
ncbi:signal transduction histidine kinase [Rhizobium sp. PP-F2F-G38]|nr:signal transduction histidine kinase [Rhizobium sp. PP-F2F-G38]